MEKDATGRKIGLHAGVTEEQFMKCWGKHAGNVSAVARELGITRSVVRYRARALKLYSKPVAAGSRTGTVEKKAILPAKGLIKRYICTSAQNNTYVNEEFVTALEDLAEHYDAEILVGTFTYNQNAYGNMAVKRGKKKERQTELWYDPRIEEYICDKRIELGNGLIWCGEMNILPTAVDPLSGLETYTHRKSAIFPHAKVAMRSIATMQGEGTKLNFTTGTVTLKNYIQKKEGIKAEHHHRYAALIVEVNHDGQWWVRQVGFSNKGGKLQDLDVVVEDGEVTTGNAIEAVTWGDLHGTMADPTVVDASMTLLDALKPKYQFLHDVCEGVSFSRHQVKDKNPHVSFHRWMRGLHRVDAELIETVKLIDRYKRDGSALIVPDSNHDGWWLRSWLAKYDYRPDAANAELFLDLQTWFYKQMRSGVTPKDVNLTQYAFDKFGLRDVKFLLPDESYTICGRKIECGMHGHLGPNGARGTPDNLNKIGRRANTAHTHSAGIYNGLYIAGASCKLKWDYNWGPSSWSHSHVLTYPNGMRTVVTMWDGKWRA
jgi:hypothetical protein